MTNKLTFEAFRAANVGRAVKWHPEGIASWSPSDWLTAVTGELVSVADELGLTSAASCGVAPIFPCLAP